MPIHSYSSVYDHKLVLTSHKKSCKSFWRKVCFFVQVNQFILGPLERSKHTPPGKYHLFVQEKNKLVSALNNYLTPNWASLYLNVLPSFRSSIFGLFSGWFQISSQTHLFTCEYIIFVCCAVESKCAQLAPQTKSKLDEFWSRFIELRNWSRFDLEIRPRFSRRRSSPSRPTATLLVHTSEEISHQRDITSLKSRTLQGHQLFCGLVALGTTIVRHGILLVWALNFQMRSSHSHILVFASSFVTQTKDKSTINDSETSEDSQSRVLSRKLQFRTIILWFSCSPSSSPRITTKILPLQVIQDESPGQGGDAASIPRL